MPSLLQRGQAPEVAEVAELIEEAEALEVDVAEVDRLRKRAAAAAAWATGARAHLQRFPPMSAQPPQALALAQDLIQVCEPPQAWRRLLWRLLPGFRANIDWGSSAEEAMHAHLRPYISHGVRDAAAIPLLYPDNARTAGVLL